MKNGADITAMTSDSSSVLHFAAAAGNGDVVKRFLSEGLQIDLRDQENRTALHRCGSCTNERLPFRSCFQLLI